MIEKTIRPFMIPTKSGMVEFQFKDHHRMCHHKNIFEQPKTSKPGRKCRTRGCGKVLSIYNHDNFCHVHKGQELMKLADKVPYSKNRMYA